MRRSSTCWVPTANVSLRSSSEREDNTPISSLDTCAITDRAGGAIGGAAVVAAVGVVGRGLRRGASTDISPSRRAFTGSRTHSVGRPSRSRSRSSDAKQFPRMNPLASSRTEAPISSSSTAETNFSNVGRGGGGGEGGEGKEEGLTGEGPQDDVSGGGVSAAGVSVRCCCCSSSLGEV